MVQAKGLRVTRNLRRSGERDDPGRARARAAARRRASLPVPPASRGPGVTQAAQRSGAEHRSRGPRKAPRPALDLDQLRGYAVARTLFAPTTLARAIARLGFVQADPIRAPARAQDLTLRHRVKRYRAGDLERRYPELELEEGFFINYGFLPRAHYLLLHPRVISHTGGWDAATRRRVRAMLAFIRERERVHPREIEARFAHGAVTNYWGRSSNATTRLLEAMHYRGLLRVVGRDGGIRLYALQEPQVATQGAGAARARLDALVDVVVQKYAPLPEPSLRALIGRLRWGMPQLGHELPAAFERAKRRLAHARVEGVDWYWPADERPLARRELGDDQLRLLAPFDPLVWDRRRFELFWGWAYRFEAYTPRTKRKLGYYALPLLWRDQIVGWGNVSMQAGRLECRLGFTQRRPRERAFEDALEAELAAMRLFLGEDLELRTRPPSPG